MARALNGHAGYRCRFKFRQITQEMCSLVRGTPSSSNPDGNTSNISVRYPSKKMSGLVRAESRRIELLYLLEFEHDDANKKFDQSP